MSGYVDTENVTGDTVYTDSGIVKNTTLNREYNAPGWVNVGNEIGYVMLEAADVNIKRSINDVNKYLTITIDHGNRPRSESYAYVVLPSATAEETEDFANSGAVEILAMNESLHAVRDSESGTVMANAFVPNQKILGFTFSDSCSIIINEEAGVFSVSIADPTLSAEKISVLAPSYILKNETDSVRMNGEKIEVLFKERGSTVTFEVSLKQE